MFKEAVINLFFCDKMKASHRRVEQHNFLNLLKKSSPENRNIILSIIDDRNLHALGEFSHNVLYKRSHLTPADRKKLKDKLGPHQKVFEKIAQRNLSNKLRRKYLIQQNGAGILGTLLTVGEFHVPECVVVMIDVILIYISLTGLPLLTSFLWPSKPKKK